MKKIIIIASALLLGLFILNHLPDVGNDYIEYERNIALIDSLYPAQKPSVVKEFYVDGSDSTLSYIDTIERDYCTRVSNTEHKAVYLDDSQDTDSIFVYHY